MSKVQEPYRVTIVVSGGNVQNVYTTFPDGLEVDVLDFDNAKVGPAEEEADMVDYLAEVEKEQREVY